MWAAYNLIVILQSEKTREIFLKDKSTVTQKLTMEGDPAKTTVDLRCARRCSARAGTGAEISKSYVKELLTHYTRFEYSAAAIGASLRSLGQLPEGPQADASAARGF